MQEKFDGLSEIGCDRQNRSKLDTGWGLKGIKNSQKRNVLFVEVMKVDFNISNHDDTTPKPSTASATAQTLLCKLLQTVYDTFCSILGVPVTRGFPHYAYYLRMILLTKM